MSPRTGRREAHLIGTNLTQLILLLWCSATCNIATVSAQMDSWGSLGAISSFYGSQAQSGVRESLLAINSFCDQSCSVPSGVDQMSVSQCLQSAIAQHEIIVQILRACTINSGYIIYCAQNSLVMLENCVLQYASAHYSVTSVGLRNCFRQSLAVGELDCLRMHYPRLNRFFPLGSPPIINSA